MLKSLVPLFKYLQKNIRVVIPVLLVVFISFKYIKLSRSYNNPVERPSFGETTVMITNFAKNSGGSGVIYSSDPTESLVLTNAHVCKVVVGGGVVHTSRGIVSVADYKLSNVHDICMIRVRADLGVNTEIAEKAPNSYDKAVVAGHPALLPTIVTEGHFSDKMHINVLTEIRECTAEEFESPLGIFCILLGGIPVIKTYETIPVSATIMGGSSGSGVFDKDGKIAGLVFAGSGQIGYAFIVPHEYVKHFVETEMHNIRYINPSNKTSPVNPAPKRKALKAKCLDPKTPEMEELCNILERDITLYHE